MWQVILESQSDKHGREVNSKAQKLEIPARDTSA
jgi:hypothetical protein